MKFYSTNNRSHQVSLQHAVLHGLAPDQGLYMPEYIPKLPATFFDTIEQLSFQQIAFEVANALIGSELSQNDLKTIVNHTVQFDVPVVKVEDNIYSLELFHGPTLAFKDFGARFLSGLLSNFAHEQSRQVNILVATSGDTGSAVANGFLGVEGTRVIVLYPSGKVSDIQEKQFTTLGKNIIALEVNGTFDDCQRLVKQAFSDKELNGKYFITSANSINIARLIPQSFYYFFAYAQLKKIGKEIVFCVPSGNFGNVTAGLLAKRMGLPVKKFIVATNINKVVPDYLETKIFKPIASQATISNAMDVGNPSNFPRMLDLYQNDFELLSRDVAGAYFTDEQTQGAMREVFARSSYVLDPHGAIGYLGLKKYLHHDSNLLGVFLETAHPAKFKEVVDSTLSVPTEIPERLIQFLSAKKNTIKISSDFGELKSMLPTFIA